MCLPVAIIGGILAAAGAGAQYVGQKKADHALSTTFNRERDRQHAFQQQQDNDFKNSLSSTQNLATPEAQAAAAASREGVLSSVTQNADPVAGGYLPTAASAPSIVATAGERAGAKSAAATSGLAKALASMGGFNDLMQKNDITMGHDSQDIGQIGGFMRGSLNALQPEMDAAKMKGGNLRMLGGLAQSIGMSMLSGGLGGGGGASGGGIVANTGAGSGTANFFAAHPFAGVT